MSEKKFRVDDTLGNRGGSNDEIENAFQEKLAAIEKASRARIKYRELGTGYEEMLTADKNAIAAIRNYNQVKTIALYERGGNIDGAQ